MNQMILRTILVDDEPRGLNSMERLLQLNCPDVEIVSACSSVDAAIEHIRTYTPPEVSEKWFKGLPSGAE